MRTLLLLLFATLLLPAMPAEAMPATQKKFNAADVDKDGHLSPQEFKKSFPDMNNDAFGAIDIDKDGRISVTEWQSFTKEHSMGRKQDTPAPISSLTGDDKPVISKSANGTLLITPPAD